MRDWEKEIFEKMSNSLKLIYNSIVKKYDDRAVSVDEMNSQPVLRVKIKVGENEIYGDISDCEAYLKCSSGPNILDRKFMSALEFLSTLVECAGL